MVAIVKMAYEDILKEMQRVPKPSHFRYELSIYVQGKDERVNAIQIIHIDITQNFEIAYSDQSSVQAVFHQNDFVKVIYPNRNILMAELKRIPIGEMSEDIDQSRQIVVRNFRATVLDHREDALKGGASTDDSLGMREVVFQLFDPLIEKLRLKTFGAVFNKAPVENIIKWHLCHHSRLVKVSDEHSVKGVEMWEPNRADIHDATIVPHGVPLLDLPGYIQKHQGGVYNHGLGCYLYSPWTPYGKDRRKGRLWYVYPLYDPSRYEKSKYRLDIIVIPQNQITSTDRSWYLKDSTFYVATTGQITHVDEKDYEYANLGNAVRFAKATDSFEQWAKVESNKAVADSSKSTGQFFVTQRDNGLNAAPFGENRFTDNVCYEMSKLTARATQYVKLVWNNSSSEFLYPGMPVRIIYHSKRAKEELYGTLLAIEENASQDTTGLTSKRMRTNCALTLAVTPRLE